MHFLKNFITTHSGIYMSEDDYQKLLHILLNEIDETSTDEEIERIINSFIKEHGVNGLFEASTKLVSKITSDSIKRNAIKLELLRAKKNKK